VLYRLSLRYRSRALARKENRCHCEPLLKLSRAPSAELQPLAAPPRRYPKPQPTPTPPPTRGIWNAISSFLQAHCTCYTVRFRYHSGPCVPHGAHLCAFFGAARRCKRDREGMGGSSGRLLACAMIQCTSWRDSDPGEKLATPDPRHTTREGRIVIWKSVA
jgi:hypothetical protein